MKKGKDQCTSICCIKKHPPQSAAGLSFVAPPGAGAVGIEGRGALVDAGDIIDGDVVIVDAVVNEDGKSEVHTLMNSGGDENGNGNESSERNREGSN